MVDEEQKIWELNEDDNTFTKSYVAPSEVSSLTGRDRRRSGRNFACINHLKETLAMN